MNKKVEKMEIKTLKILQIKDAIIATDLSIKEVENLISDFEKKYGAYNPPVLERYIHDVKPGCSFRYIYFRTTF